MKLPSNLQSLTVILLTFGILATSFAMSVASSKSRNRRQSLANCPTDCRCFLDPILGTSTVQCSSMDFINKLSQKDFAAITSLDISNTDIDVLDKRLRKMSNLEQLNLSHNKISDLRHFPQLPKLTYLNLTSNTIKSFSGKSLPSNLVTLDVSHNFIRELPRDVLRLQLLKRIVVSGNPFTCSPESLDTRDLLLEHSVDIVGRVVCHDPVKFRGRSWISAVDFDEYFKLHDQDNMQADEMSGSGDGEAVTDAEVVTEELNKIDSDFTFDGSGEEGSGEIIPPPSTVAPLASAPTMFPKFVVSTTSPMVHLQSTMSTSSLAPPRVTSGEPKTKPLEENTEDRSMGTYIFLGILLLCFVVLVIYAVKQNKQRKRQARSMRRELKEKQRTFELQPKSTSNEKQNGSPEVVPLINGQNGNTKQPEPSAPQEDIESNFNPSNQLLPPSKETLNDSSLDYPSRSPNSFTSDVKTVKVKASEIPDSVPHTPILITRSISSDGKHIVVTPNLGQRSTSQPDSQQADWISYL